MDFVLDDAQLLPFFHRIQRPDGTAPHFELLLETHNNRREGSAQQNWRLAHNHVNASLFPAAGRGSADSMPGPTTKGASGEVGQRQRVLGDRVLPDFHLRILELHLGKIRALPVSLWFSLGNPVDPHRAEIGPVCHIFRYDRGAVQVSLSRSIAPSKQFFLESHHDP